MHCKDLVKETICALNQTMFEKTKNLLLGEYLSFSILNPEDVTPEIFAEKLCDYFAALENKTGKSFDKSIETYMNDIDSVVGNHIAAAPHSRKDNDTVLIVPRTRKYYEKAITIKKARPIAITNIFEYTRIMICLYTAIIKSEEDIIQNFDYSANCLEADQIIEALKNEESTILFQAAKKKKFDTKELYCADTSTMILSIIILCSIISSKLEGDNEHE